MFGSDRFTPFPLQCFFLEEHTGENVGFNVGPHDLPVGGSSLVGFLDERETFLGPPQGFAVNLPTDCRHDPGVFGVILRHLGD